MAALVDEVNVNVYTDLVVRPIGRHSRLMDWFKGIGAAVTTFLVFAILGWSLYWVFHYIGSTPEVGSDGKVVLDKFKNAKDILLAVLPMATAATGYWFGSKGTAEAQAQASKATARTESLAAAGTPDILVEAKRIAPKAWE